jgi:hypothetical protein
MHDPAETEKARTAGVSPEDPRLASSAAVRALCVSKPSVPANSLQGRQPRSGSEYPGPGLTHASLGSGDSAEMVGGGEQVQQAGCWDRSIYPALAITASSQGADSSVETGLAIRPADLLSRAYGPLEPSYPVGPPEPRIRYRLTEEATGQRATCDGRSQSRDGVCQSSANRDRVRLDSPLLRTSRARF